MSRALDQKKQELVMRLATSRLHIIDAASDLREHAKTWPTCLPYADKIPAISYLPTLLKAPSMGLTLKIVGGLGGGVMTALLLRRLFSTSTRPCAPAPVAPEGMMSSLFRPSLLRKFIFQFTVLIILPYIGKKLEERGVTSILPTTFPKADINRMFYRWLGWDR